MPTKIAAPNAAQRFYPNAPDFLTEEVYPPLDEAIDTVRDALKLMAKSHYAEESAQGRDALKALAFIVKRVSRPRVNSI